MLYAMHKETRVFEDYEEFTKTVDLKNVNGNLVILGLTKYLRSYINKIDLVI